LSTPARRASADGGSADLSADVISSNIMARIYTNFKPGASTGGVQSTWFAREKPCAPCLKRIAATRLTASNFRTQEANRREAIDRLVRMIRQVAIERPVRTPTPPSLGSKLRRLAAIAKRGDVKSTKDIEAPG
jgi:hypothetical protein